MDAAHKLHQCLNGLFCIYKPPKKSMKTVNDIIKLNLAKALNSMDCRPLRPRLVHHHDPHLPSASIAPDLSDHPLVVGARYLPSNFKLDCADALSTFASGVTVMGINGGIMQIKDVVDAKHMKVYHIGGMLGRTTTDLKESGKVLERSSHEHVTLVRMERVLAGIQAGHQRNMFLASGVDLQSEEAYKLAQKGLIRPSGHHTGPVIYAVRCISFKLPYFTLELHSINETSQYLLNLIHNLGIELKTNAVCTQLRRIRHGLFSLSDAILPSQASEPDVLLRCLNISRVDVTAFKSQPNIGHFIESGGEMSGGDAVG